MTRSKKEAYRCIMGNLRAIAQEQDALYLLWNWGITKWCVWWYVRTSHLDDSHSTLIALRCIRRNRRRYPQNYSSIMSPLVSTGHLVGCVLCGAMAILLWGLVQYGLRSLSIHTLWLWLVLLGANFGMSWGFYCYIRRIWDQRVRLSVPYRFIETCV